MKTNFNTIYHLFDSSNTQYRIYDIGRKVQELSQQDFRAFEDTQIAYPYPIQQTAKFAVLFWTNQTKQQHYLWFLSFGLDEQGKLIQATRDHFVGLVIDSLDTSYSNQQPPTSTLSNNPYSFTPDQNKLAYVNALIRYQLNQPASVYYEYGQSYLRGEQGWDNWQQIGIQGLADIAVRLDVDHNESMIIQAINHLPEPVLFPLCNQLEHTQLPLQLTQTMLHIGAQALKNHQQTLLINMLRSIASTQHHQLRQTFLQQILTSAPTIDILMVIVARCWHDLQCDQLRHTFLEQLAALQDLELFRQLVTDCVAIPNLRAQFLHSFRNPQRSAQLSSALGYLFRSTVHATPT